jgi:endonuclease YncB( thermonuclease family)
MPNVIKFRRRRRRIPGNVFLPVFMAFGVLLNFVDWESIGAGHSETEVLPIVHRGGDALNGGQRGLGGFGSAAQPKGASLADGAMLVDRVTKVRDGDTIVVGLIPIRIANLDCAESGTRAGNRATAFAKRLVSGATLSCRLEGRRSYDREVGVCSLPDGQDFGEILISAGLCERW